MAISIRELIVAAPRGSCKDYFAKRRGRCFVAKQHNTRGLLFINAAREEPEFFVTEVRESFKSLR